MTGALVHVVGTGRRLRAIQIRSGSREVDAVRRKDVLASREVEARCLAPKVDVFAAGALPSLAQDGFVRRLRLGVGQEVGASNSNDDTKYERGKRSPHRITHTCAISEAGGTHTPPSASHSRFFSGSGSTTGWPGFGFDTDREHANVHRSNISAPGLLKHHAGAEMWPGTKNDAGQSFPDSEHARPSPEPASCSSAGGSASGVTAASFTGARLSDDASAVDPPPASGTTSGVETVDAAHPTMPASMNHLSIGRAYA